MQVLPFCCERNIWTGLPVSSGHLSSGPVITCTLFKQKARSGGASRRLWALPYQSLTIILGPRLRSQNVRPEHVAVITGDYAKPLHLVWTPAHVHPGDRRDSSLLDVLCPLNELPMCSVCPPGQRRTQTNVIATTRTSVSKTTGLAVRCWYTLPLILQLPHIYRRRWQEYGWQ